jgi:hypothetical protein
MNEFDAGLTLCESFWMYGAVLFPGAVVILGLESFLLILFLRAK